MLSSHPLFERFPQSFDFRWPMTYKKVRIEWRIGEGGFFFRPQQSKKAVIWHALDVFGQRTPEDVLAESLALKQLRRALPLATNEFVFWNQDESIFDRSGIDVGASFSVQRSRHWNSEREFLFDVYERCAYSDLLRLRDQPDSKRVRLYVQGSCLGSRRTEEWFDKRTKSDHESYVH